MKTRRLSQRFIVAALLVLLVIGFSIATPAFLRSDNLIALLQNVAILGILSLGMALIVIGRGVDLAMIASLAVPTGLMMQMVQDGHSVGLAFGAAISLALAFGALNGWLIAYAEVPALFTTLASGLFLAGLGQSYFFQLETVQWPDVMDGFAVVGRGNVMGIPVSVWMFGGVSGLIALYLKLFRQGQFVYAMGDNPLAARATGIPARPMVVLQYICSTLIAAFAGLVMAASLGGMPTRIYNSTLIYDVILVVVLGGIGLAGGRGGVSNVLVGTLLIGTMLNGLTILDVSYSVQSMIKGIVLLAAIVSDSIVNPRNEETEQQGDI